jgi:hypothetical protein
MKRMYAFFASGAFIALFASCIRGSWLDRKIFEWIGP